MALISKITYNPGGNTVTAVLSGCVPGHDYYLQPYGTFDVQTAVGTTLTLSCAAGNAHFGTLPAGFHFDALVHEYDSGASASLAYAFGSTTFAKGTADPDPQPGQWLYDGDKQVSFTAVFELGVNYGFGTFDAVNGSTATTITGAGVEDTMTVTMASSPTDGVDFFPFIANVWVDDADTESLGCKVFVPANTGFPAATRGWPGSPQPPGTDVIFDYNGGNPGTASVTFASQAGVWYVLNTLDYSFAGDGGIGTGAPRSLSVIGAVIGNTGESFSMALQESDTFPGSGRGNYIASASFTIGTVGVFDDTATFDYDGANSVDVTFPTTPGQHYVVTALSPGNASPNFYDSGAILAAGSSITDTVDSSEPEIIGDGFWVYAYHWKNWPSFDGEFPVVANRLFQTGVPGIGLFDLTYNSTTVGASAVTNSATPVERTLMQLNAVVNPGGVASVAYFQYGLTNALGSETPHVSVGSGSAPVSFDQEISGLMPNHRYYYRAVLEQV